MGGFVLAADDLPRPIPLNAEQLFYLVKNSYVEYPTITAAELKDRNKSDGLARSAISKMRKHRELSLLTYF